MCVHTIMNIDNNKTFNTNFTCFFCRRVSVEVLTWIAKTASFHSLRVSMYVCSGGKIYWIMVNQNEGAAVKGSV